MHIDFTDQTRSVPSDYIDLLQQLIIFTGNQEGISSESEISINFVNNNEMKELNRNYRQKDEPTDVLSFAMQESVENEPKIVGEDIPLMLGDIVISIDKAKEQAKEYNHSLERELGFLAVHGFLHLLGYDHIDKEDEMIMFKRQEEILGEFGIER